MEAVRPKEQDLEWSVYSWNSFPTDDKINHKGVFIIDEGHKLGNTLKGKIQARAVNFFARGKEYIFILTATPSLHSPP